MSFWGQIKGNHDGSSIPKLVEINGSLKVPSDELEVGNLWMATLLATKIYILTNPPYLPWLRTGALHTASASFVEVQANHVPTNSSDFLRPDRLQKLLGQPYEFA